MHPTVFGLPLEHKDAEKCTTDWDATVGAQKSKSYWQAAKGPLSVAHALAQQGAELALKSQIASASPFLLISVPPSEWPRGCDKHDTPYADFRTLDAQDLIRAYNTVREAALPDDFVATFEKFRKQRNALFHTVDERLEFSGREIIRYIVRIAHLIAPGRWPQLRREHLEGQPFLKAYAPDLVTSRVCSEMGHIIALLGRADLKEFFGFDKKRRCYICPRCYWDCDRLYLPRCPRTAQLQPNSSMSKNLYCFVCGNNMQVVRRNCLKAGCKGNVINAADDHECLTCFEAQDEVD